MSFSIKADPEVFMPQESKTYPQLRVGTITGNIYLFSSAAEHVLIKLGPRRLSSDYIGMRFNSLNHSTELYRGSVTLIQY